MILKASNNCINLIKKYEGCKLQAYQDSVGVWTIGYGHTSGVKMGDLITQQKAEEYLLKDLLKFEDNVRKYNNIYHFNQNQFDALVSFAYNVGSINRLIDNGKRNIDQISSAMLLYNKAGGKIVPGLVKRREEERELFIKMDNVKQSGIVRFSLKMDGNKNISTNFKVKEFYCKDGSDEILIDVDFVKDVLQNIRDHFGNSVIINSAYRTISYNKKVGGAKNSYHTKGKAFDIVVKGKSPKDVAKYAQILGVKGIIQYPTFVHVDSRENKYWAINIGGVKVVNGF